jgi:hypothetical protein
MVDQGEETLSSGDSFESPSEGELVAMLPINVGLVASLDEACAASMIVDSAEGSVRRLPLLLVVTIFTRISRCSNSHLEGSLSPKHARSLSISFLY